jgi:DNA invertase Pin-like site-specific DNA recombinase
MVGPAHSCAAVTPRLTRRRVPRVIGYARVSSEEQARGTSLHDQQEAIKAYAAARKLTVARFYVEAESAVHEKIERREKIRALLRDVKKGDLVLVDKIDRWSRDPEFTYRSVREILAAGANLYAVGDQIDASTPEGDTALGFRILFAREEHKRIKQRLVGTRNLLRERGYYADGAPPFGYRRPPPNRGDRLAKNVLAIVPDEAAIVRRVFELYVRGRSFTQIAAELDLTLFHTSKILHRRTYIGEVRTPKGEWIKGHHEPIVSVRTFERAQRRIEEARLGGVRVRENVETSTWIARDVARCGLCGARMSAVYGGRKEARRYYYRCAHRCTSKHVRVDAVEEAIAALVLERLAELREQLAEARTGDDGAAPVVALLGERKKRLAKKRERYIEAHAADLISLDELREKLRAVDAELAKIAMNERPEEPLDSPKIRASILRDLTELRRAWKRVAPAARRRIVNRLAVAIHIAPGAAPDPRWRVASDLVEN